MLPDFGRSAKQATDANGCPMHFNRTSLQRTGKAASGGAPDMLLNLNKPTVAVALPRWREAILLLAVLVTFLHGAQAADSARTGDVIQLNGRTATVRRLDSLPYVESDYTKRFRFDAFDNPKLKELRERYRLSEVVARGKDEFERQVLLMDWTHRQFKKFGPPSTNCHGALEILKAVHEGHMFFCAQYVEVFVSAAASLGWVDRPLALRRHQGVNKVGGSTEHSVTEMWSNQHRKWVMFDPTSNMILEKGGIPLNAFEIREEWFRRAGTNLVFLVGKERRQYRKANLPIILGNFPMFGELAVHPDELDKYGFIGWIPNTDLMDSGYDYAKMFILRDSLCDGTTWHVRQNPENPAVDPYFPIGQAALMLQPDSANLRVTLKTLTPNFKQFEVRIDRGVWSPAEESFVWELNPGANRLEARTVNQFGVKGPLSTAELLVK